MSVSDYKAKRTVKTDKRQAKGKGGGLRISTATLMCEVGAERNLVIVSCGDGSTKQLNINLSS